MLGQKIAALTSFTYNTPIFNKVVIICHRYLTRLKLVDALSLPILTSKQVWKAS